MRTIHKYPFKDGEVTLSVLMPRGAKVIHIAIQSQWFCVWALVDTDNSLEWRHFELVGTGHPAPIKCTHINSHLLHGGNLVLHAFEIHP